MNQCKTKVTYELQYVQSLEKASTNYKLVGELMKTWSVCITYTTTKNYVAHTGWFAYKISDTEYADSRI